MIQQNKLGLNSRLETVLFNKNGFLPIMTAPMYSVVDNNNYNEFVNNNIQVCLPRGCNKVESSYEPFYSVSLSEFKEHFLSKKLDDDYTCKKVCIDTANGNMPKLHDAIKKAKKLHPKLVIMAGNVASEKAFVELAKTGVDYIRVGIGGGGACSSTSNTGVGQENLELLIRRCNLIRHTCLKATSRHASSWDIYLDNVNITKTDRENIRKVKIVADGISTYINQCHLKYGYNFNGYAAINKLLWSGADVVMIGKLFVAAEESAAKKEGGYAYYKGMSTKTEQEKYKYGNIRHSEGKVLKIPVEYTLYEWLYGSSNQDKDQLAGFIPCLRSAMSYTGAKTLTEFKDE